jgi:transcriptional regulator with XRE-family HTH domain
VDTGGDQDEQAAEMPASATPFDPQLDPIMTVPLLPPPAMLRAARHFADLSQRELAKRAGVAHSVVGDIESGRVSSPAFAVMVELLEAAGLRLQVLDQLAFPLYARPFDEVVDKGGRHWPGHLDVVEIRSEDDWWYSRVRPGERPLPEFTADWRRLQGKSRVRRTKGQSLEDARARARARNTPPESEVTGGDAEAG